MKGSEILVHVILGFLLGVLVSSIVSISPLISFFIGAIGLLFLWFFRHEKALLFTIGIFLFCSALGSAWYSFDSARLDAANAWMEDGQKFDGKARVIGDPLPKNTRLQVVLEPEGHSSRLLGYVSLYSGVKRGDTLTLVGTIKKIKNFTEDFDYVAYLRAKSILYELSFPTLKNIEPASTFSLPGILGGVRAKFLDTFRKTLPEPHSALLGGITIGADEGLEPLDPIFKTAGISHIIVLSGYNITIVASVVQSLLIGFGFWISIWGGILGVILFTLMAGLGASAVRAAVMAVLALIARSMGREYDAGRALLLAVFIMVFLNPRTVFFDISFQLSVLATLGILYCPDRVSKFTAWIPEKFGLRDAATTTLAAQVFVVPFMLYTFGSLSLISLPANIAILPLVPLVMALGTVLGLVGFMSTSVASVVAFPCYMLLGYIIAAARFFAAIPFASISFGKGSLVLALLLYFLISFILFPELWKRKKQSEDTGV